MQGKPTLPNGSRGAGVIFADCPPPVEDSRDHALARTLDRRGLHVCGKPGKRSEERGVDLSAAPSGRRRSTPGGSSPDPVGVVVPFGRCLARDALCGTACRTRPNRPSAIRGLPGQILSVTSAMKGRRSLPKRRLAARIFSESGTSSGAQVFHRFFAPRFHAPQFARVSHFLKEHLGWFFTAARLSWACQARRRSRAEPGGKCFGVATFLNPAINAYSG